MGTRCTTQFYQIEWSKEGEILSKELLANLYRQYDGSLGGHGKELRKLLKGKRIINGISNQTIKEAFNGMGCLAAWIIGKFKKNNIGNFYIQPLEQIESYNYEIYNSKNGEIMIKIENYDGIIDKMPEKDLD